MNDTSPIFIFSAGWRSGSTLLQRYLTATGGVLIWGESGGAINHLRSASECWAQMLAPWDQKFSNGTGGGEGENLREGFRKALQTGEAAHAWIATMNPPMTEVAGNVKQFLSDYYGKNALELGFARWGAKYTLEDLASAHFLKSIFPDARFLFLVRDPFKTILSIKRHNWMGREATFQTLRYFAKHWQSLARAFSQNDLGLFLRYEDFTRDPSVQRRVLDHVNLPEPPTNFISASHVDWLPSNSAELTLLERTYLRYLLKDELSSLGYA